MTDINCTSTKMNNTGYLAVYLGCMYAGKTSKLISIYNKNKTAGISTCVINYIEDKRYHDNKLSTHDRKMIECLSVRKIYDVFENDPNLLEQTEAFIINEGQFFSDLYEVVKLLVNEHNKQVYVCGLDGDYQMRKFGQILDLVPICDEVVKLHAICTICKAPASFTKRITQETEQKVIGSDNHIPVCRMCHLKKP
jgi:thymidine kinase